MFESTWSAVHNGGLNGIDYKTFLKSPVLIKGKGSIKPDDQKVLSDAISCVAFKIVPDSIKTLLANEISALKSFKSQLAQTTDQEYLDIKPTLIESLFPPDKNKK